MGLRVRKQPDAEAFLVSDNCVAGNAINRNEAIMLTVQTAEIILLNRFFDKAPATVSLNIVATIPLTKKLLRMKP